MTHTILSKFTLAVLLLAILAACQKDSQRLSKISGKQLPVSEAVAADAQLETVIAPYKKSVDKTMGEVLAYNLSYMVKTQGEFNTAIGNLMADVVWEQANPIFEKRSGRSIDFVLLNHGGIRAAMQAGDVTRRTAFEVMPFENEIVVLELKTAAVQKMKGYLERAKRAHPVSGLSIGIDNRNNITKFLVQGKPLDENQTYFVATSDYLRDGGDQMEFFAEAVQEFSLDYKIRNALIDYFEKIDTLDYKTDERFVRVGD